jgi:cytochrome bd ubiquinol oxidase subunit II
MDTGYANLNTLWFALIAVLWIGYFVLEGFDFGVGINLPFLGRDTTDRRVLITTIGPVWDGNEVWLLTAGGATFAAFPEWYATLFSGFYLALFLILLALIGRGVAFEFRGKVDDPRWRRVCDGAIFVGSALPALLWGVGFANLVQGVPIGPDKEYAGTFFDLLGPYALWGGATSFLLFWLHGTVFVTLKTDGELRERAHRLANRLGPLAVIAVFVFLTWTYANAMGVANDGIVPGMVPVSAVLAIMAAAWLVRERIEGWAFAATAVTIVLITATLFLNLYSRVMPSSIDAANDLTIWNAASTPMTLRLMSVVALVMVPIVLLYQGWTYYVFRGRISRGRFDPDSPVEVLGRALGGPDEAPDDGDHPASSTSGRTTSTGRRLRPIARHRKSA